MKRLALLIPLFLSILYSCEKYGQDGGYSKRDIYILIGDVPVDAQDYVLTIPSEAGEYDIPFLTWGISGVTVLKDCTGMEVSVEDNWETREEYAFMWGYKEYVHLKAEANTDKKSRKLKFALWSAAFNGFRADITIKQKGR